MGDPESSSVESTPLGVAERDADGNFGFVDVGRVVSPCASALFPAVPSGPSQGSFGSSSTTISSEKKHWVEIAMVDQEGMPVPGQAYEITLPDATVVQGSTDAKGRGRVDGIDAGNCRVTFPRLDREAWKKK
jgi:hypothetical protein